jgi:UDP-N-acetylmuramoyl-L-alanyl-D-glutamate--2,6-diaminopimelate ligase
MTVRELLSALRRPESRESPGAWTDEALDSPVTGVTHDSREAGPGAIFVAIRGASADGAAYAPHAIAAGAAAVVADRPPERDVRVPWIVVPDTRVALAALAGALYAQPSHALQVVGVTGTNGKTTITFLLRAIFDAAGVTCGVLGTVGYSIGDRDLPATHTTPEAPDVQRLLRAMVSAGCGACAMEVSSHALALHRVDGTRFAAAAFTNLTRDHLDFHPGMEDYFAAKRRLFEMLPAGAPAVVNVDDPRGAALLGAGGRPVTYGITRTADVMPGALTYALSGLQFDVRTPQGPVAVRSRLLGRPNVYNILAAVATTSALGVPLQAIEAGLRQLAGVPGRFEVVSTAGDDITIIVDYAHTDDALRNLLETARPMASRRLVTVFGAGGDRDRTKRPLMGMVAARLSDLVVITSDNPRSEDPARIIDEVRRGADAEIRQSGAELLTVLDRRQAIGEAVRRAQAGDVVLIAGKGHEKYQEIGGTKVAFDDVAVAQEALEARRVKSRVG